LAGLVWDLCYGIAVTLQKQEEQEEVCVFSDFSVKLVSCLLGNYKQL
jgi:hypothetical protein